MSTAPLSLVREPAPSVLCADRTERRSVFFCRGCGRRSASLTSAHCSVCHQHFVAVSAFDLHRAGDMDNRHCLNPETATRKDGALMFETVERAFGPVWRRARRDSEDANPFGTQAVVA